MIDVVELKATVEYVSPLTNSVLKFVLKPEKYVPYYAGQYLQLISDDDVYSYSIANAPLGSMRYELHIRHSRDNTQTQKLLSDMKNKGEVRLKVPFGNCSVACIDATKPIIFIAAGSGFAPIKAMLEQLFADCDERVLKLYWRVSSKSHLYMNEKLLEWQGSMSTFSYSSDLSESRDDCFISKIIQQNSDDLLHYQIVMSGPFDFMYDMRDALTANGVSPENIFSDAFSFE
ncbi:MAG: NAD(P)H-flavin reductase [Legionellaceae bacterium]|nr:NAD(P)H-flavin reductase [Legionellaceae bacterium]